MNRWKPRGWPDWFELALTVASIYSGLIYIFGPERLRAIYVYVNQFTEGTAGMQVLGVAWLLGGLLILSARVIGRPTPLRRIGHAVSAGVYVLMAVGLASSIPVHGPSSSGAAFFPYLLVTMLHVYFGTHEPRLTRRPPGSSREG